jgi:Catalytic LigB subunit of aromatic ring-opening dioxygenase
MAQLVLGIGTSHSPLLTIDASLWAARGEDDLRRQNIFLADGRVVSYQALASEVDNRFAGDATLAVFERQSHQAQESLDRLARDISRADLDLMLVIGDDQEELFSRSHMPALAIYTGEEIVMHPKNEVSPNLPEWYRRANQGYLMDTVHRHPAAPALSIRLVEKLIEAGVDVSIASKVENPRAAGFGHAYGFVIDRLLARRPLPILPIMLNTYFPPNVPTPRRCYEIGRKLAAALAELPEQLRVCVLASGGLTHFATDEAFDQKILAAMRQRDAATLASLPVLGLRSGNSEVLNWIMAAGALESLRLTQADYVPVRRTPAGTGIGLGFCTWQ